MPFWKRRPAPAAGPVVVPVEVVEPSVVEAAPEPPPGPARHPALATFIDENVDQPAMHAAAGTGFERAYYAHGGRPMFKWVHFLPLYDQALSRFVGKAPRVLEIGLAQGGSLQLWKSYLGAEAHVVGLDLMESARAFEADGFPIYIGDQGDAKLLAKVVAEHGPFDIIIDDGSHIPRHQLASFHALWPHLKTGGVYVCEDLHANYWEGWEGGLDRPDTFIAFLKNLADRFHDKYWRGAEVEDLLPEEVAYMTWADSIVFLHKQTPATPRVDLVGAKLGA